MAIDIDQIIAFENGDLEVEGILDLFSELVSTGSARTLQGSYGRYAAGLIDAGWLATDGTILRTATEE